jgi:NADH dehydrogenase
MGYAPRRRLHVILVTGGTGFVGASIVEELLRRGKSVAVLGRDAAKVRARFGDRVEPREADVRDASSLAAAFAGADVVVNAVQFPGSPVEDRRKGHTFEEVDLKGTRHQVDAARAAGARRFVYLSGAGASRDATRHWYRYKWEAEKYLQDSGDGWTVLRPTWIYGPGDVSLNRILGLGRRLPFVPLFGDGKQDMQPVFVDDVGRIGADAALRPEAAGELLEVGGPEVMSMNDVIRTALDVMGRKRAIIHQPAAVGKAFGALASLLPSPQLSADAIEFITAPATADNTRLLAVLAPRLTPLREGLRTYLRP